MNIRTIARHEAGHIVMHYLYNGLPVTAEIDMDGNGKYCGHLRRNRPPEASAMIYAAGYAAEYWNTPLHILRRQLWYCWPQIRETWPDFAKLNQIYINAEPNDRARYLQIRNIFFNARRLLLCNREKIHEVTAMLIINGKITKADAESLFNRWRNA